MGVKGQKLVKGGLYWLHKDDGFVLYGTLKEIADFLDAPYTDVTTAHRHKKVIHKHYYITDNKEDVWSEVKPDSTDPKLEYMYRCLTEPGYKVFDHWVTICMKNPDYYMEKLAERGVKVRAIKKQNLDCNDRPEKGKYHWIFWRDEDDH